MSPDPCLRFRSSRWNAQRSWPGNDDKHISTVDEGGVVLAAIQQLSGEEQKKNAEIPKLYEEDRLRLFWRSSTLSFWDGE